jgi:hypothetical protein
MSYLNEELVRAEIAARVLRAEKARLAREGRLSLRAQRAAARARLALARTL